MTIAAVVTAAGSGTRLGAEVPKALVPIHGRPLVAWAVDAVREVAQTIVVTAPEAYLDQMREALPNVTVVPGAHTRQGSVAAGLAALELDRNDIVLIHDAARAFTPVEVMRATVDAVRAGATGAVPVIPVVDSLVSAPDQDGTLGDPVDRASVVAVQTPQTFRAGALLDAHHRAAQATQAPAHSHNEPAQPEGATDDASLVRAAGHRIAAVPGHEWGFKVTRRTDLPLAMHVAMQLVTDFPNIPASPNIPAPAQGEARS